MFGHRCSFYAFIIVMSCMIFMDDAAPISAVGWANLPTDAPISEDTIVRELNPPTGKNDLSEFWKNLEQQERNREERRKKQQEDNDQFQRNFAESMQKTNEHLKNFQNIQDDIDAAQRMLDGMKKH